MWYRAIPWFSRIFPLFYVLGEDQAPAEGNKANNNKKANNRRNKDKKEKGGRRKKARNERAGKHHNDTHSLGKHKKWDPRFYDLVTL